MTRKTAGFIAGLAFLLHLPSFLQPFMDLDESSYAGIACRLLDGGTVYRDAVENKFPAVFYVYKEVFAVFGRYNMLAIHVCVTVVAIATALLVAAIAKRYAGPVAARWAAIFYVVYSASYYPRMLAGNSEMFAVLPAALAVYCYLRGRDRHWAWMLAAGVAGAFALLCKQVAFATFLALCADRFFTGRRQPLHALRDLALLVVGCAAVVAAVVLELRALGVWDDAVFWTWTYVFHYYIPAGDSGTLANIATSLLPFLAACSPLVYLAVRGRSRSQSVVYWWLVGNLGAATVGGRMYGHYFLLFVPALCVLAGIGAEAHLRRWLVAAIAVVGAGTFVAGIVVNGATSSLWSPTPDYREAAHYVADHTWPDDRIFVWGWFPALYHAADRCPSTRFVYTHIHSGNSKTGLGHDVPEAWDMLMHDLEAAPPPFVLDTSPGKYTDYDYPPENYPRLWQFLSAHYEVDRTIEGVRIFRRR
ncbi:MAG TPA: glycosyltransferase family 39 protein [Kofleriaceae bacterium]|nr:glycosyltransferase family 39 protein [Kofleriaceae bacterium]